MVISFTPQLRDAFRCPRSAAVGRLYHLAPAAACPPGCSCNGRALPSTPPARRCCDRSRSRRPAASGRSCSSASWRGDRTRCFAVARTGAIDIQADPVPRRQDDEDGLSVAQELAVRRVLQQAPHDDRHILVEKVRSHRIVAGPPRIVAHVAFEVRSPVSDQPRIIDETRRHGPGEGIGAPFTAVVEVDLHKAGNPRSALPPSWNHPLLQGRCDHGKRRDGRDAPVTRDTY